MGITNTPLRYPGGKSIFTKFLANFIELNELSDGIYVEPFAGGAGAGINLLFSEYVNNIILNDADYAIYCFWKSILYDTEKFLRLLNDKPINVEEWQYQRKIFRNRFNHSELEAGFSAFYLNRCNRSGILYAGPIGGQSQEGEYRINARYNKRNLTKKIEKIALYNFRISIYNLDAIDFLEIYIKPLSMKHSKVFVYLDPPYYIKGSQLYMNFYEKEDHVNLSNYINAQKSYKWIVSYDDVPEIKELYETRAKNIFPLNYFAHSAKLGKEVLIFCPDCHYPDIRLIKSMAISA